MQDVGKTPDALDATNNAQERLFGRFAELGIDVSVIPYPEHRTVEEGKALRGQMLGQFTELAAQRQEGSALSDGCP